MPRRPRPPETRRSEHWLRLAVKEHSTALDSAIRASLNLPESESIEWRSPVIDDDYAEYYDEAFLERLGITNPVVPLRDFWPASGPRWDGLARTSSGKLIIVEAKAYIEEAVDYRSQAGTISLEAIGRALAPAREAFGAAGGSNWNEPFYQYANRLAHLYYLRTLNALDAYLVFIYFVDAPDVPRPCAELEWRGAIRIVQKALGLGAHPFTHYIGHVFPSVPEMLSNISRGQCREL